MRLDLLVFLMLFLLVEVQGIRVLQQEFSSAGHQIFHEENERSLKKESDGVGKAVAVLCRDGHCSGRSRKLIENSSTSSTSTYSKSVKNSGGGTKMEPTPKHGHLLSDEGLDGTNKENFSVESSPAASGQGKMAPEHHPDIIDITRMDYSPAKRKPPIHN
ncbi:uncharacterized protein LOC122061024 [Macadamia integrifolia]|uniref:uncharacterized protein LOC122061024 n=1 Tax=Macadamia integrifolia TaxID=60698 RepID=UPI001C4FE1B7|nr:uncharacterized protein LOC122061024 [Macadamia integrifolia]